MRPSPALQRGLQRLRHYASKFLFAQANDGARSRARRSFTCNGRCGATSTTG